MFGPGPSPLTPRSTLVAMTFSVGLMAGLSVGCGPKPKPAEHAPKSAASEVPPATRSASGQWEIPAAGARFAPPVKVDEIADGAWYCDMGTVHYAQRDAGDKTCKLCKMKLKHKVAAAQAQPQGQAPAPGDKHVPGQGQNHGQDHGQGH